MTVKQIIVYTGDLRCRAIHEPSQTEMITDAPVDNMGKGESFSPTDLVATSLASCLLTTLAIVAKRNKIELGPSRAEIEKHMTAAPPRRIAKLVCRITASGPTDPTMRKKLEAVLHSCPTHLSLHPDVIQDISIVWE